MIPLSHFSSIDIATTESFKWLEWIEFFLGIINWLLHLVTSF